MPSRTGTRQPCRLPTPSTVTRHSKQTPIRQYGARGAPLTGVVGSLQAMEAAKLLAGAGETLAGRLLLLDANRP